MKHPLLPISLLLLSACSSNNPSLLPAAKPAIMSVPLEQSMPDYWFNKPAVTSVQSANFQKLWDACHDTLINDQFEVDRQDYRLGLLTTMPMISKQFFEPWRSDAGNAHEILQDSLQTIRRTVHFEFIRQPDGLFIASPKVLMEQSSHPERRLTAQPQISQAFNNTFETPTRINEEGISVPNRYWYSIGRDDAMEKELANSVREKLQGGSETTMSE